MHSRLTPLLKLFYNPLRAMSEIGAGAPYLFGAVLALVATTIYRDILSRAFWQYINNRPSAPGMVSPILVLLVKMISASASPLFFLIVVFVPACLFAASLIEKRASFTVLLRQEYAPLVSCALYGWAAAHLIMFVPALALYQPGGPNQQALEAALRLVPLPYFVFLMTIALRAVLQMSYPRAIGAVAIAACSLIALPFLSGVLLPHIALPVDTGHIADQKFSRRCDQRAAFSRRFRAKPRSLNFEPRRRIGSLQSRVDVSAARPVRRGESEFHSRD
jgi:hypothetical protein